MKAVLLVTVLFLTQAFSQAGDTAYQALRIVGKNNQELLNHVIQVQGTDGEPQPATWRILIDDQSARGGVREMEISKGRVISEHTPVRQYAGTGANVVMDFKKLNLDSSGAFTIANDEATKHNVSFNSVDYMLRSDEQSATPVWILKLIDVNHALVGTLTIAADTGAVLHADGFGGPAHATTPVSSGSVATVNGVSDTVAPANVVSGTVAVAPAPPVSVDGDEPDTDQPVNHYGIGHEINKSLHRIGGTLQQFFTGKRTVDKRFDGEP